MAQEDHSQRHSNSSGGSGGGGGGGGGSGGGSGYDHHHHHPRSSKKSKQKKVPQRGLGVAQLEKIRLEEIQKNEVSSSVLPPPPSNPIISRSHSSNCLGFRPAASPPPLIPLPPPLIQNMDVLNHSHVPLSKGMNSGGGGDIGWLTGGRGGSWPNLWSDEYNNVEGEDRGGFGLLKNVRLPYESNSPAWPLPNGVQQRSQQFQQPCSSSMVNVSTGTSSSSVMNFQMEPPSNQSYCGNSNFTPPLWPEEDKMVGMKRPYPFSIEDVPIPPFHCKFPSSFVSPISRSDESASCSNAGVEPSYPVIREGPSNSSAISEPSPKKFVKENGGCLNGDFLTLALPETHSSTRRNLQLSTNFETLPPQGTKDDPIHVSGQCGMLKQQTFINFLPPAKIHSEQAISHKGSTSSSNGGETGERVDLNLKL